MPLHLYQNGNGRQCFFHIRIKWLPDIAERRRVILLIVSHLISCRSSSVDIVDIVVLCIMFPKIREEQGCLQNFFLGYTLNLNQLLCWYHTFYCLLLSWWERSKTVDTNQLIDGLFSVETNETWNWALWCPCVDRCFMTFVLFCILCFLSEKHVFNEKQSQFLPSHANVSLCQNFWRPLYGYIEVQVNLLTF